MENTPKFDQEPEPIPSEEEVRAKFAEFISGEYTEVLKLEDENGIYAWEVSVPGEKEGEIIEYAYCRKGRYAKQGDRPQREISETEIHVTYYQDGDAYGGTSLQRFVEGRWIVCT